MSNKKIVYGLKNVTIFPITNNTSSLEYGSPIKLEGAKSMTLTKKGEQKTIYADDMEYMTIMSESGYEGTLNVLYVSDEVLTAISEIKKDSKNVLVETVDTVSKPFGLAFEFKGNKKKVRYILYNVTAELKEIASKTQEKEIDPQEIAITLKASANPFNNKVLSKTTEETDQTTYDNWYTQVYVGE